MSDDLTDLSAGYAYAPGDGLAYWNFGTYWRLLASGDTTRGRSPTFDELFLQGLVAPPHVHDDAEEAFFVLEEDLVFTLGHDDEQITAPPGTDVYIPPGTRHSSRSHPARPPWSSGGRSSPDAPPCRGSSRPTTSRSVTAPPRQRAGSR